MKYSVRLFRGLVGKITTGYNERVMYGLYRDGLDIPLIVSLSEAEINEMRDFLAQPVEANLLLTSQSAKSTERPMALTSQAA